MNISLPEEIRKVIALLEDRGFEAWLVGGSVRDCLLGESPRDWDLATCAQLPDIQAALKGSARIVPVGAKFGTISLISPDFKGEVSTFRGSSLDEDLARRDFTVNAMAWHPQRGLQDPHRGSADIKARLLRCPGEAAAIFSADALRMMRAARFSAQLDFAIEAETLSAITELHSLIDEISPERIREELSSILVSPRPGKGLQVLQESGLLNKILPELQECYGFDQRNPHHDKDVYEHIVAVVENTPRELTVRLAALLHDIGKPLCQTVDEKGIGHYYGHEREGAELAGKILRRLRYDNETIAVVKTLVREHMLRINYPRMNPAKLLARVGPGLIESLFVLQEADAKAGADRSTEGIEQMRMLIRNALADKRPFSKTDLAVTGRDLLEAGVPAGAKLGQTLDKLLAAVIRNPDLNTREELLKMADKHK